MNKQTLLKYRSRFGTFESLEKALAYEEETSNYYQSLNGEWQFKFLSAPELIPNSFLVGDYSKIDWTTISVPGHFELQGFGKPMYTNFDYPFPVNPPHVPAENPTGLYYRTINLNQTDKKKILRFDGVDSCFDVWFNGHYLGASQGSRLMSEFDITDYVLNGENQLAVSVSKWSSGSYLEDQDMWWLSGIFRDVTILEEESNWVTDLKLTPKSVDGNWQIEVKIAYSGVSAEKATSAIYFNENCLQEVMIDLVPGQNTFYFPIDEPKLWSDEEPNLYMFVVHRQSESFIPIHFGLREVKLINNLMCLNGIPILFNGVNRHEFSPDNGRVLSKKEIFEEVKQIKHYHINAIRTSHYPNTPYFYDICDELGLMVIDECDIETHGFNQETSPANDPIWKQEFINRGLRMVHRDFNHPCILIWSLGNESHFGDNFVAMAESMRAVDPSRLIHYEGDRDTEVTDMYSTMYTSVEDMSKRASCKLNKLPHILCEYGHAMGNGPGNLQEYQDIFRLYDSIQGGFIWEWKDHGICVKDDDQEYFAYGGDFGEKVHDGDFVIDGLVLPDGTPSPGLLEYTHIIQPFQFYYSTNTVAVKSLYRHKTIENLSLVWELKDQGIVVDSGISEIGSIKPGSLSELIDLETSQAVSVDAYIQFSILFNKGEGVFSDGELVGREQFSYEKRTTLPNYKMSSEETTHSLVVNTHSSTITINKLTGNLQQVLVEGKPLLAKELSLTLWRTPISNDMYIKKKWQPYFLDQLSTLCRSLAYVENSTTCLVLVRQYIAPPVVNWGIEIELELWITNNGVVEVKVKGWFDGDYPKELPRIGYDLPISQQPTEISWYGKGQSESYPDSNQANFIGIYTSSLADWAFPYIVPQETGNRMDVRWAKVTLEELCSLTITNSETFNFNVVSQKSDAFEKVKNRAFLTEMIQESGVILRIDHQVRGLGSNSCGPEPLEKYKVLSEPFAFDFKLTVN